jgi:hypothetical protein
MVSKKLPEGYRLGYTWKTRKEAVEHAKSIRRSEYGIMKRKIHYGVKVVKVKGGYSVYYKESKGWIKWLRTGRG